MKSSASPEAAGLPVFVKGGLVIMGEKGKNILYILAAVGVTVIGFVTGLWLVWGVIITLMFVESLVSNLKSWADERENRYLEVLQKTRSEPAGAPESIRPMQLSLAGLEERVGALEKQ